MGDPWAGLDDFHRAAPRFHRGNRGARKRRALVGIPAVDRPRGGALRVGLVAAGRGGQHDGRLGRSIPSDDALLTACRAVGQYMGIEVRPPHKIGDESRRRIERPPGRPGASRRFSGAARHACRRLVAPPWRRPAARTDERRQGMSPWHSCRSGRARAGSGRLTSCMIPKGAGQPVDLELAGRIDPTAWMFYRTLPDNVTRASPT